MIDESIMKLRNDCKDAEKFFAQKLAFTLGPVELKEINEQKNIKLIDVRHRADYEVGHIPGAISIPMEELPLKINELNKEDIHIVYCYNEFCHLAARAAHYMAKNSLPVIELCGGYRTWAEDFHFAVTQ